MSVEIFATFGPSCADIEVLKGMISQGLGGMRLNLSHMTLPMAQDYINEYRRAAQELCAPFRLLIDMQGPELRIGNADITLNEGDELLLGEGGISIPRKVITCLKEGMELLLDDGKLLCVVEKSEKHNALARVLRGGYLASHKSLKVKGVNIKMPVLTEHDIENIKLAKQYGVTGIMQPFVQCGQDLRELKSILFENGAEGIKIYAKIENRAGADNIRDIIPFCDAVVIARGDLGNDMPLWELPRVQKELEAVCHEYDKPYIVVTQMLASMENSPVPTRAEVSDIFHAVYHGAWGVMITGESAIGKYPVEAVKYLKKTADCAKQQ